MELNLHQSTCMLASIFTDLSDLIAKVAHVESSCNIEYWMELPIVGLAFATYFQMALVCLSISQPHTCLPMISMDGACSPPDTIFAIAHVRGGTHFIPVSLSNPKQMFTYLIFLN